MYCNYTVIPCAALLTAHRHRSSISRLSINAAASRAWSSYSHNRFSKSDSFVAAQPLAYRELLQGVCLICWETHTSNRLRRQEEESPQGSSPSGGNSLTLEEEAMGQTPTYSRHTMPNEDID